MNSEPATSGHAAVRGIRIYYEVHGTAGATPLVLLPGGGSTIDSTYSRVLPYFARHRRVIAIDEQNHGRSEHRSAPERFNDSADDVAELLRQLDVAQADVMGFSNGASIGMRLALRQRGLVRKLVFTASMTKRSGTAPQFWEYIRSGTFEGMPQPLKDAFLKVNPDPRQLRDMYEKDAERMRNFVETSDEEVRSLDIPTLIVAGDQDVPTLEHTVELARLLPQARVMILPGGHGEFLGEIMAPQDASRETELAALVIERFLDAPS